MTGPIFWPLLFVSWLLSKPGGKKAEQCKNKQQNSSLQPQPTSPVIWEKTPPSPHLPLQASLSNLLQGKKLFRYCWVNRGLIKLMRMTNVTLYPCWTPLQAAEANPSADAAAFVSATSALYQYANHTGRFWSQSLMVLLLLFQGAGTSHCSELLFIRFSTLAAISLEYSNINSWGLFQGSKECF